MRVRCLVAGETGSPVVLLHGGGVDWAGFTWKHVLPALSTGHRVFAPDMPGYRGSDKPEIEYTIEFYIGFLGRLMDALGLEKASLVGLSEGGVTALGFALSAPERVEKLVLVDSYGIGGEVPWGRFGYLLVRLPLVNTLTYAMMRRSRALVRRSLQGIVGDRSVVTDEMVEEVYGMAREPRAGRAFAST